MRDSETVRCPDCKQGQHRRHQNDYRDAKNQIRLCRCPCRTVPSNLRLNIVKEN